MAAWCLPAGRRAQPPADRGERHIAADEPPGLAGLRLLLPQPAGQVVVAAGLSALPGALRTCDEVPRGR